MERAIDVAACIADEYKRVSGKAVDKMKLQKLLYLAQRENIALAGQPLFSDAIEAWKDGPVCRAVWQAYNPHAPLPDARDVPPAALYIVQRVIMQYGGIETWSLRSLTHAETSWKNARHGLPPKARCDTALSFDDMRTDSLKVPKESPISSAACCAEIDYSECALARSLDDVPFGDLPERWRGVFDDDDDDLGPAYQSASEMILAALSE